MRSQSAQAKINKDREERFAAFFQPLLHLMVRYSLAVPLRGSAGKLSVRGSNGLELGEVAVDAVDLGRQLAELRDELVESHGALGRADVAARQQHQPDSDPLNLAEHAARMGGLRALPCVRACSVARAAAPGCGAAKRRRGTYRLEESGYSTRPRYST